MSRDMKRGSYQKDGSCRGAPNLARLVSVSFGLSTASYRTVRGVAFGLDNVADGKSVIL